MINNAFITYAADILGDTDSGLSGGEIIKYFSKYAVQYAQTIPHFKLPFRNGNLNINKRTALAENLRVFKPAHQFSIIKELCANSKFADNPQVQELLTTLVARYPVLEEEKGAVAEIIKETKHWLDKYPEVLKLYDEALQKKGHNIYPRNLLDDLRLSLEILLKEVLGNSKSLENQTSDLGKFLESKNVSPYARTLYIDGLKKFASYQNNSVKHDDRSQKIEVDFIVEQTTVLMRFLVQLDSHRKSNKPNEKAELHWDWSK